MGDMIKISPSGRRLGKSWDEKGHTNIVQIFVFHDKMKIQSIQFQYVENGGLVLSEIHGADAGSNFDVVKLNYPSEYITRVSGRCYDDRVYSITFGTNYGEYGPFGGCKMVAFGGLDFWMGEEFCFKLGDDKLKQFGGFYGTVKNKYEHCLESIGVYLNPNITSDDYPHNNTNLRLLQY